MHSVQEKASYITASNYVVFCRFPNPGALISLSCPVIKLFRVKINVSSKPPFAAASCCFIQQSLWAPRLLNPFIKLEKKPLHKVIFFTGYFQSPWLWFKVAFLCPDIFFSLLCPIEVTSMKGFSKGTLLLLPVPFRKDLFRWIMFALKKERVLNVFFFPRC